MRVYATQKGYPDKDEGYPQYQEIREIGQELNTKGKIELMRMVFEYVKNNTTRPPREFNPVIIEAMWDGIGTWRY